MLTVEGLLPGAGSSHPTCINKLVMIANLFVTALPSFWQSIRMALRLDPEIYALVQVAQEGLKLALWVVLLAALSEAFGQSVVLLINRVRPPRFVLAVTIAVASNVIGYLLWSTVIWLAVWLVFGAHLPFASALAVVGLAYAPQLFAFFEVTPYFGNFFGLVLTLWSMAAIVVAVRSGMGLTIWQAAVTGLLSWIVIQLWRRSLGRPIYALGRAIERRASGTRLEYSVDDAIQRRLHREKYSQNWMQWIQQQRDAVRNRPLRRAPRQLERPPADEMAELERARRESAGREVVGAKPGSKEGSPHA